MCPITLDSVQLDSSIQMQLPPIRGNLIFIVCFIIMGSVHLHIWSWDSFFNNPDSPEAPIWQLWVCVDYRRFTWPNSKISLFQNCQIWMIVMIFEKKLEFDSIITYDLNVFIYFSNLHLNIEIDQTCCKFTSDKLGAWRIPLLLKSWN